MSKDLHHSFPYLPLSILSFGFTLDELIKAATIMSDMNEQYMTAAIGKGESLTIEAIKNLRFVNPPKFQGPFTFGNGVLSTIYSIKIYDKSVENAEDAVAALVYVKWTGKTFSAEY